MSSSMLLPELQKIVVPAEIHLSARSPKGSRTALLYRAGDWDQAHTAAQDLDTPEGSFWHGILHRHEGDWSNASYWFRRVGKHPVYSSIYADAADIMKANPGSPWQLGPKWDSLLFIQWCEEAAGQRMPEREAIVTQIQVSEWRHLFEWCIA